MKKENSAFVNHIENYFLSEGFNINKSLYKKQIMEDLTSKELNLVIEQIANSLDFLRPDIFHETHPWKKEEFFSLLDDTLALSGSLMHLKELDKLGKNAQRVAFKIAPKIQKEVNQRHNQHYLNINDENISETLTVYDISPSENNDFFPKDLIGGITDCSINIDWLKNNNSTANYDSHGWHYSDIVHVRKGDYYTHNNNEYNIKGFYQNEIFQNFIIAEDSVGRILRHHLKQDSNLLKSIHKSKLINNQVRNNKIKKSF